MTLQIQKGTRQRITEYQSERRFLSHVNTVLCFLLLFELSHEYRTHLHLYKLVLMEQFCFQNM